MQKKKAILANVNLTVVSSNISGMGKTKHIEQRAAEMNSRVVTVLLSGDPSPTAVNTRKTILKEALFSEQPDGVVPEKNVVLHLKLDMMDSMLESCSMLDSLLFELCYFKCVPYSEGYLFLDHVGAVFVEVQNSFQQLLLAQVSMLSIVPGASFSIEEPLDIPAFKSRLSDALLDRDKLLTISTFYKSLKAKTLGAKRVEDMVKNEASDNASTSSLGLHPVTWSSMTIAVSHTLSSASSSAPNTSTPGTSAKISR